MAIETETRTDRLQLAAARILLQRVTRDRQYVSLDEGLRISVERFVERSGGMCSEEGQRASIRQLTA